MVAQDAHIPAPKFFGASLVLMTLLVVGLGFKTISLGRSFLAMRKALIQDAQKKARHEIDTATGVLETELKKIRIVAGKIAEDLFQGELTPALEQKVSDLVATTSYITAIGVFYADPSHTHYYVMREHEAVNRVDVTRFYNYAQTDWFMNGMHNRSWLEPMREPFSDMVHIRFCTPFFSFDKETQMRIPRGVVVVDLSLKDIVSLIESLSLRYASSIFILSPKGVFLSNPVFEYSNQLNTFFDISRVPGETDWSVLGEHMVHQESGIYSFINNVNKKKYWAFYEPIFEAKWSIGTFYLANEPVTESIPLRRLLIKTIIGLVLFLSFLFALLIRADNGETLRIWLATSVFSALVGIGVIGTCFLDYMSVSEMRKEVVEITGPAELQRFLSIQSKVNQRLHREVIYVPTNLYISTLDKAKSGAIKMQGIIWQIYDEQKLQGVTQGVRIDNATTTMKEIYRIPKDGQLTIGWQFKTELPVKFDYYKYPFDKQVIDIQFVEEDFSKNIALLPDFQSYDLSKGAVNVWLDPAAFLEGWHIGRSYFNYLLTAYGTNFGIENFVRQKEFPELRFSLELYRDIFYPLVDSLLPILVILFLVFVLLLIAMPLVQEETTMSKLVAIGGSIVFAAILAQNRFTSNLSEQAGITYIEYYYFLIYGMIMLVMIDIFVIRFSTRFAWLRYERNLIAKVLYWPIVMVSIAVITLAVFY